MRNTTAWPLALVYGLLIVFASLFPFDGWRAQGIDPSVFLFARIPPPYWTWFDVNINIVGYAPLGDDLDALRGRVKAAAAEIKVLEP